MARLNLSDCINDLHPPHPPCFKNRLLWVEYLQAAAACQNNKAEPKIIVIIDGEPRINADFPFCADCTQIKSVEMDLAGRCDPLFLVHHYDTQRLHRDNPASHPNQRPGHSTVHRISP